MNCMKGWNSSDVLLRLTVSQDKSIWIKKVLQKFYEWTRKFTLIFELIPFFKDFLAECISRPLQLNEYVSSVQSHSQTKQSI